MNFGAEKESSVILGIETSCDETAVAVLDGEGHILSNILDSQIEVHARYGGVVPELASRRHIECLELLTREALGLANVSLSQLTGIAVTNRPGLVGALLVGVNFAKALAFATKIPLVTVNHLEGHLASAWLSNPNFPTPAMVLIASGGHTHLALVPHRGDYQFIGWTMDDAAGEAFDKGAKMLGLPYPGGPAIDRLAQQGNAQYVSFPRPTLQSQNFNFSFSGLKTALRYFVRDEQQKGNAPLPVADIAASYQEAIVDVLVEKLCRAARHYDVKGISVVGGVAANSRLRLSLEEHARPLGLHVTLPSRALCTDNGAMIAAAGLEKLKRKERAAWDVDAVSTLQCKLDGLAMAGLPSQGLS
ncbi:MAG: tRNA (adenosine(37)-N6)-threonylcarbamoyltransferase complex transferase subunit TsaD [Nitrospiraceae bacterium]|nr:tRNA (adenosine(37)-N6)-threonylcarbamoyltransferase complex transferase subunit TsaD [Nitrospiraceae bacterium]